jgi:hypothetical protein
MTSSRRITLTWTSDITSGTIAVILPTTVAQGSVIQFQGTWTDVKPAVIQYTTDGVTWVSAAAFQAHDDGTFEGDGPVATNVGTLALSFRDRNSPLTTSDASTNVVSIGQVLTLSAIADTIVGQAAALAGTWNGTTPSGLEYSLDGVAWSAVTGFVASTNGTWVGTGNVPGAPGQFLVRVRRTDQIDVVSNAVSYSAVFGDSLVLNAPAPINAGSTVALTGTWTGTKPSALQYSLDGGSTWPGAISAFGATDNGNTTGGWHGTGPVFSTGGTFFIRVRNTNANQIVSASAQVTVATPVITLNVPASVTAGTAFVLTGTWVARRPTAMDYSTDGGTAWIAVTGFSSTSTSPGTWTGVGPTPGVAGNTNIKVRDHTNTATQSLQVVGVATSGAIDALTLDVPTPVGVGTAFTLGGTWTNTEPGAVDYSTDAGSTWTPIVDYLGLGASPSGGWTGTGPTPSVAGNISIKVRNHDATSVQSGTVTAVAIAATLTLNAIASTSLGVAVAFSGGWSGTRPSALDWSVDSGANWTALVSPTINTDGTWSATGPIPAAAQTYTYIIRDHDHTGVVSGPQSVVITNGEVITLDTPASTVVGNSIPLSGTWAGVRPGASLVYTTDNFATGFHGTTNYSRTADDGTHQGTWLATGPTPTVVGNLSIRVMDGGNTAAKSNAVTAVVVASGPQPPAVSLNPITSVAVANPVQLNGGWITTQPTAMDYTTNSGGAWAAITSFSALAGGTWSGVGPTPLVAGTLNVQVRDHNAITVTSGTQPVTVTATPPPPSLTLTPPASVTQGSGLSLNGGWVTTKPTAMDYTIDNSVTWIAIGGFTTTGTTGTGGWSGVTLAPAIGTYSVKVRDHNAQSVQAGPVTATVTSSGGGTGTQALRVTEFTNSLGVNIHFDSSTTIPGVKDAATLGQGDGGVKTITAMQSIGITKYRTGWFWPQPGPWANDQVVTNFDNAGLKLTLYPIQTGNRDVQSVSIQMGFIKRHNLTAFEGGNEVDLYPLHYNVGGVQYDDVIGNGPFPATAHVQLDVFNATRADTATRNLPIVMPTSGYGDSSHYTKIRDSAGVGHDWGDRCTDVNAHNYTPGDVHYTNTTNYLQNNYNAAKLLLPSPARYVSTEWGNNTATGGGANWVSEAAQNKLDWAGWVAQFMFGLREMFRYELWDFGIDKTKSGDNWGFFRKDASSSAKPIVATFTNVFTILKDNGSQAFTPQKLNYSFANMPTGNATFGQGKAVTLQASNGSFYLIVYVAKSIWNTGSKTLTNNTPSTVTLNLTTAAPVLYFDPLLSATARLNSSGAVTSFAFPLNDTPIILKVG